MSPRPRPRPDAGSTLRYVEYAPGALFAHRVECYWSISAEAAAPTANRVLPDGCADLIVGIAGQPGPVAVGTMRTALVHPVAGAVDLFGVRFRPGGSAAVLGLPLAELTDRRVPLDALWGREAARLQDILPQAATGNGPHLAAASRIARLESLLLGRLARAGERWAADERLVRAAVALLRQSRGGASVREVAAGLGVGERRLERAFDAAVGIGPKALARVLRLRRVVRAVDRAPAGGRGPARGAGAGRPTWSGIAALAGYADQSHLIREFRALAGLTPARWAAERRGVGFVQSDGGTGG